VAKCGKLFALNGQISSQTLKQMETESSFPIGITCVFDDLLESRIPMHQDESSQAIRAKSAALFQLSAQLSALLDEGDTCPKTRRL
jgi:geranylgeranyl pyrophosphate synthase